MNSTYREFLGKVVRMVWIEWAREQPDPKPSWLAPWEELTEPEREVDRRIGERIYTMATEAMRREEEDRVNAILDRARTAPHGPSPVRRTELPDGGFMENLG